MDDDDDFTSFSDALKSPVSVRPPVESRSDQASPINRLDSERERETNSSNMENPRQSITIQDQLYKIELLKKKEQLLQKRQDLNNKIEKLKRQNRKLKETKQKLITEKTLEALIQQNNQEFATDFEKRLQKNKQNETDDAWSISRELLVEPSSNWELRLEYIKRFLIHILFLNAEVFSEIVDSKQLRIYSMHVYTEDLFKVPLTITIDADSLTITNIKPVFRKSGIFGKKKLRSVAILSPNFHNVLLDDYIPNNKIQCIIYGLNSLASTVYERTKIMKDVIVKLSNYIVLTPYLSESVVPSIINMNKTILLKTLKNIDTLKFAIPSNESHPTYLLTINWVIVINNQMTGECGSAVNVVVEGEKNLQDVTSIFMKLMKDNGFVGGLCILLKNLFDIPV